MANKLEDMKARLTALDDERTMLDAAIERLIANMAEVPPESRAAGDWAPNGASTRKYLEMSNRQAQVETEIAELGRALAAADTPAASLH